jgi:DNA-binding transcriptional MerR regulator
MDEKYKVGEISRLLGIPIQTLHYYEKCGFVSPQKDKYTSYRYYDAWDVNYLLDSKYLHSFAFTNAEIEQMLNKSTIEDIQKKFDNKEEKLIDLVIHYQKVLDVLSTEKKRLASIQEHTGKFTETKSPPLFFTPYRLNNSYQDLKKQKKIPQINSWLSRLPFVTATFKIAIESLKTTDSRELNYWWGYSVSPNAAREMNISTQGCAEYIPSKKCMYTVFSAHDKNTFIPSLYDQVIQPIRKDGYEINDEPVGKLIIRFHDGEKFIRYFEIWVPVG